MAPVGRFVRPAARGRVPAAQQPGSGRVGAGRGAAAAAAGGAGAGSRGGAVPSGGGGSGAGHVQLLHGVAVPRAAAARTGLQRQAAPAARQRAARAGGARGSAGALRDGAGARRDGLPQPPLPAAVLACPHGRPRRPGVALLQQVAAGRRAAAAPLL